MVLRKMLFGLMLLSAVSFITSCDDDDDPPQSDTYVLSGAANGAQEVPAVTTSASGTLSGQYNSNTNVMQFLITWNGLSAVPTAMHFHGPALPGATAGPIITITGFPIQATGSVTGNVTLTDPQEADMLMGRWYYNIHNTNNPNGEIRGQVTATRQ